MKKVFLFTTENELNEVLDLTENKKELEKLYEDYLYNNKANGKQRKLMCIKYDGREQTYLRDGFHPSITRGSKKFNITYRRSGLVAGAYGSKFPDTYYGLKEQNNFTFRPTNKKYSFYNGIYTF